ncbi:MAG: multifunctional acyl-CoA thioesterase and protease and lysophospholipase [Actinomycetia bacterium]|nr:multifunctional acyl-CoA thioesterase and protease and lysophospholipase [Actinomycetes bacterium]
MWARSTALGLGLALLAAAACGPTAEPTVVADVAAVAPARPVPPPVVPRIDAALQARLRAVVAVGRARGNRPGVFAKVGDSITASRDFLVPIGCGPVEYGRWSRLRATVERWSTPVAPGWLDPGCPVVSSFTRVGASAAPGWQVGDLVRPRTAADALCPPPARSAVECELDAIQPTLALVEIGSNDVVTHDGERIDPDGIRRFEPQLRQLLRAILEHGVVPVVSTVPPRHRPVEADQLVLQLNRSIVRIAGEERVPVWNYWRALQSSSQFGMAYDWVHPSPAPTGAGDLRDPAMGWGYNVRNLTALQVLEKVGRVVLDDGAPDA